MMKKLFLERIFLSVIIRLLAGQKSAIKFNSVAFEEIHAGFVIGWLNPLLYK